MILSFHPNIVAHRNILCAGRGPNAEDLSAICEAQAVILSQGCREGLYRMCRKHCLHVFPNYDVRFDFPGKVGQARLFQQLGVPFPRTVVFQRLSSYYDFHGQHGHKSPLGFPCVFKFNWGGEGEGVLLLDTQEALKRTLQRVQRAEQGGLEGFLLQEYIPCEGRSLRVVVVGDKLISYWKRQQDGSRFLTNLGAGAIIDHDSDPHLQREGRDLVKGFCSETGINLAAFDLLFGGASGGPHPLFLEINYFFGRRGLGGSLRYYELVNEAVRLWLKGVGLSL